MQTYFDALATASDEQRSTIGRGKDSEFPKDHMLFVQRDMFNDTCFPHVIIPSTQEAFLSFFVAHHHRIHGEESPVYRLEVQTYGDGAIAVVHYEQGPVKSQWVNGFLRYNLPQDMSLPFVLEVTPDSLKLSEGWSAKTLYTRDQNERVDNDILLWSKDVEVASNA